MKKSPYKYVLLLPCLLNLGCGGLQTKIDDIVDDINKSINKNNKSKKVQIGDLLVSKYQKHNINDREDIKAVKNFNTSIQEAFDHQPKQIASPSFYEQIKKNFYSSKLLNIGIDLSYCPINNLKGYFYGVLKTNEETIGESFLVLNNRLNNIWASTGLRAMDINGNNIILPTGARFKISNINSALRLNTRKPYLTNGKFATISFSIQKNQDELRFSQIEATLNDNTKSRFYLDEINIPKLGINIKDFTDVETFISSIVISNFLAQ